jgi:hypothetical protein
MGHSVGNRSLNFANLLAFFAAKKGWNSPRSGKRLLTLLPRLGHEFTCELGVCAALDVFSSRRSFCTGRAREIRAGGIFGRSGSSAPPKLGVF